MALDAYAWPRFDAAVDHEAELRRAREEAAERGYAEGRVRAEAEVKRLRDALAEGLAGLSEQVERIGEAQSRAVTELAFAVARKLLIAELRTNPAVLQALVEEALAALEASLDDVRVLVNPADLEPLQTALTRLGEAAPELTLKADPSVPLGGVSVSLGVRSVEFDPLARLESFVEQEMSDGAARVAAGGDRAAL
ncbi:MAG TPA: FliH/SctL family protein [Pseudomonadales bacterium]